MNTKLSQKEIGKRIAEHRNFKGLSQDELSNKIEISRSSLTQIELGNRNLNILELIKISNILGFSIDDFLSDDFKIGKLEPEKKAETEPIENKIKISKPILKINKFKNILLYILERCAGKPNVGETLLFKLLYFADFNYYELYEEHLTGAAYHKLPYGPVPQNIQSIINQMIVEKHLKRIKTDYHGYLQTRYLPLKKPDLTAFKASEKETIDKIIEQFSDWSAASISDYSHKDIPWIVSKDGEMIDYELAFSRELPYSVRNYDK